MQVFDFAQYSTEWWETRRGVPTASEFHRIVTAKQWKYAAGASSYMHQLIADQHDFLYGKHEQYVSAAMASGSYVEPEARKFYEFSTGETVQEVGFVLDDSNHFGCSPDGLVGNEGGLELKHPAMKTQVKWLLDGTVPDEHLAQCHGFLLVTGRRWVDFMSYCPPLPELLVRVERDKKTEKLGECLEKFWTEYQDSIAKVKALGHPEPTQVLDFGTLGTVEVGVHEESYF